MVNHFKAFLFGFAALSVPHFAHAATLYEGFTSPGIPCLDANPNDYVDCGYYSQAGAWDISAGDASAEFVLTQRSIVQAVDFETQTNESDVVGQPSSRATSVSWIITPGAAYIGSEYDYDAWYSSYGAYQIDLWPGGGWWLAWGSVLGQGTSNVDLLAFYPRSCGDTMSQDCEENEFSVHNLILPAGTYWLTMFGALSTAFDGQGGLPDVEWHGDYTVLGHVLGGMPVPEPVGSSVLGIALLGLVLIRIRSSL